MPGLFESDQFRLGVGLAVGPALILIASVYAFFKWGKAWRNLTQPLEVCSLTTCLNHAALLRDNAFAIDECKSIWLEIKEVNHRQMTLRERLPADYVSKTDLSSIQDRLKSIDGKLDRYMELAISHK